MMLLVLAVVLLFGAASAQNGDEADVCSVEVLPGPQLVEESVDTIVSVGNALPSTILSGAFAVNDSTNTTEVLTTVYYSLAEEFGERDTATGFFQFIEAVTEIAIFHKEACEGGDVLMASDLVGRYVELTRSNSSTIGEIRQVFGQLLCLQDQQSGGTRKRQTSCEVEGCFCPPCGLECDFYDCACQFFWCLDPEDDLRPIFGFSRGRHSLQSLAMVVDTTGSMGDEIEAAKEVMTNFIAAQEDDNIFAYLLTPYNDPGYGPTTTAHAYAPLEAQALVQSISSLTASGGGDCPEHALKGILLTLNATDPENPQRELMTRGSQIIVLTDAGTLTPELEGDVISMAQSRGVCIHFIFSPDCCCTTGRELYERIANETSGIVIDTLRDDNAVATLNEFIEFYEANPCSYLTERVQNGPSFRRKRQAAGTGYSDETMCHIFSVSSVTTLLRLVVNTIQPEVVVTKPSGLTTTISVTSQYGSLFLENPEGGEWMGCVETGVFRFTVNAEVEIDIFISYVGDGNTDFTTTAPLACVSSTVLVSSSQIFEISSYEAALWLLDDDDTVVATVDLVKCGNDSFAGKLMAPLDSVTYELQAQDQSGIPFSIRTRRTATFELSSYTITTREETDIEIEASESPQLVYRVQSAHPYGTVTVSFTGSADSNDMFNFTVEPETAELGAGQSIDVTLRPQVTNVSSIEVGDGALFTISASDGCASVTSDYYNVTVKASDGGVRVTQSSVLVTAVLVFLGGVAVLFT